MYLFYSWQVTVDQNGYCPGGREGETKSKVKNEVRKLSGNSDETE